MDMKLHISRSRNREFYYAVRSVRKGKKVTTVPVEKIGEKSDLLKKGIEDPLAYAKERVEQLNREAKENKATVSVRIDCDATLPDGGNVVSKTTARNVGWLYAAKQFDELGISPFLDSLGGKRQRSVSQLARLIVCSRFIHPGSVRSVYNSRDKLLYPPECSLDDLYRILTPLAEHSDEIQEKLYEGTKNVIDPDSSVLYYDCTNFYFETEEEDGDALSDGDVIQWGLRKYGASKEHRPNPIVQFGLFTDRNGIPVSYCVEHGSNNEQNTIIPNERRMIRDFGTSKFIYCSDAGLGSAEARAFNSIGGRDYVVTHSLKKTSEKELQLIFKDMNWSAIGEDGKDIPVSLKAFREAADKLYEGKELAPGEKALLSHDMIYKKFPVVKTIDGASLQKMGAKNRFTGKISFEETLFITFSRKYYLYQREIFDSQLERAKKMCEDGDPEKTRKGNNDVRRFISGTSVTDSGEVAENRSYDIDEKTVEREKRFHGFYAVATSLDTDIRRVLKISADRWRIEQSFRLMKSDFDTRPIYMSTEDHIRAHLCLCYITILMYRIMERRLLLLDPADNRFTPGEILETLRVMALIGEGEEHLRPAYEGSKILDALEKVYGLGFNHAGYQRKKLEKKFLKKKSA